MNSNRGMKKWMPFAALPEQQTYMKQMINDMEKVEKPELSEYQKEEINNALIDLCQGNQIIVSYYDNGYIRKEKDEFCKLDLYAKMICLKSRNINFENLLNIEF